MINTFSHTLRDKRSIYNQTNLSTYLELLVLPADTSTCACSSVEPFLCIFSSFSTTSLVIYYETMYNVCMMLELRSIFFIDNRLTNYDSTRDSTRDSTTTVLFTTTYTNYYIPYHCCYRHGSHKQQRSLNVCFDTILFVCNPFPSLLPSPQSSVWIYYNVWKEGNNGYAK